MTQRAAAIQSIAVLLNHRQKQQKDDLNYYKKEEKLVTKKYIYYDQNEEKPKSILKGKSDDDENELFVKEENKINNSNFIYSRKSIIGDHQRQFSDEKNWNKNNKQLLINNNKKYLSNKLNKIVVDKNNNYEKEEEETFCCCSVCGGRIWSGDEKSAIFGFEELFFHCACFQCATCGMDLVDTSEENVYKQNGRFYCQVHGPLVLAKNKNNVDEKLFLLKNEEELKNENDQLVEWWERNTDEFNGSKKSSTSVRFYGENKGKQATKNNNGLPCKSIKTTTTERQTLNKLELKQNTKENTKENKVGKHKNTNQEQNTINSACFQVGKYNSNNTKEEKNKNKLCGQKSISSNNNKLLFDNNSDILDSKLCYCGYCNVELNGSFVLAKGRAWCPEHFCCANSACSRPLMDSGFVEDPESRRNYCPKCYEVLLAPICFKCSLVLNESCINALGQKWHPECFCCTHCHKPVGASSFFVEEGKPYCDNDWNELFTTKCVECKGPIKVGQKWLEALGGQPFHADCFKCSTCKTILDGKIFFERKSKPYCRLHAIKAAIADSERKIG